MIITPIFRPHFRPKLLEELKQSLASVPRMLSVETGEYNFKYEPVYSYLRDGNVQHYEPVLNTDKRKHVRIC